MVPVNGDGLWGIMDRYSRGEFVAPSYQKHMETGCEFDPGDQIMMTDGPLIGQEFTVRAINGSKAEVLCRLLGKEAVHSVGVENMRRVA